MCGRCANARRDGDLVDAFRVDEVRGSQLEPSWNVAPMHDVRIVLERLSEEDAEHLASRQLRTAGWGLVPSWAKDPSVGSRLIYARSETVTEKPSFKAAAAKRRCIVPADGHYEWQRLTKPARKSSRTTCTRKTRGRWRLPGCTSGGGILNCQMVTRTSGGVPTPS